MSGRWKYRVFAGVLIGGGVVLGLGLAELGLRLAGRRPQIVQAPAKPAPAPQQPVAGEIEGLPDRALYRRTPAGMRLRANARVVVRNHEVSGRDVVLQTNALGFRNPPLTTKSRPRVLFLGDSITLADYVDEAATFVRQVQELSEGTPQPLETVNAGIGSVGLANELAILQEAGPAVAPDIVVLCFYLNDIEATPGITVTPPPRAVAWSWLAWRLARSLAGNEFGRSAAADAQLQEWGETFAADHELAAGDPLTAPAAFNQLVYDNFRDWGNVWCEPAWARMRPLFEQFIELARSGHFVLLWTVFPVRYQVESTFDSRWPQDRFLQLANELDVPALDVLPALREAHQAGSALYYDHCHFNEHGNRLVADWLLSFIASH